MKYIETILNNLPSVTCLVMALAFLIRAKDILKLISSILSGDSGQPSSRRFVAISSAYVFSHICLYETYHDKAANPLTKVLLLSLTILCLGLASLPQLMNIWFSIRGTIFGNGAGAGDNAGTNSIKLKKTEEVEVNSSNAT